MLTPEYLSEVVAKTEESVSKVNSYLIAKVVDRIEELFKKEGRVQFIPSSLYDVRKMKASGMLVEDIEKEIEKSLPDISEEVKDAFYEVADMISDDMAKITTAITDKPYPEKIQDGNPEERYGMTKHEASLLESAYKRTNGEIKNLTKTTASATQREFIKACDDAYMKVSHGVPLNEAIADAIDEVGKQGIGVVNFRSGKTERIEVALARAIRTGINQAHGDIKLSRCHDLGANKVIVSQHVGARVTNRDDFTNHSGWQGKTYYLDWNNPKLSPYKAQEEDERFKGIFDRAKRFMSDTVAKIKYDDFVKTCGYGEMLGICGINCRHSFDIAYPSTVNNQKPIDDEENRERYELEQKQRRMEREIRATKLRLDALKSATQTDEVVDKIAQVKSRLKKQNEAYTEFCKEHHLNMENWRRQIIDNRYYKTTSVINPTKPDLSNMARERATISERDFGRRVRAKMGRETQGYAIYNELKKSGKYLTEERLETVLTPKSDLWYESLDYFEKHYIRKYTKNSLEEKHTRLKDRFYYQVNKALREGNGSEFINECIGYIDSGLSKFELKTRCVVYRRSDEIENIDAKVGEIFETKQLLSTSIYRDKALRKPFESVYYLEEGVNCAYIGNYSSCQEQKELLINKGVSVMLMYIEGDTRYYRVYR